MKIDILNRLDLRQLFWLFTTFLYLLFIVGCIVKRIVNSLWIKSHKDKKSEFAEYQSSLLGIIERAIYFFSLMFNVSTFIPVWLTLKTISVWKPWNEKNGEILFNNFLIGNGLNLIFSFFSFLSLKNIVGLREFDLKKFMIIIGPHLLLIIFSYTIINKINSFQDYSSVIVKRVSAKSKVNSEGRIILKNKK